MILIACLFAIGSTAHAQVPPPPTMAELQQQLDAQSAILQGYQGQLDGYNQDLANLQGDYASLQNDYQTIQNDIATISAQINNAPPGVDTTDLQQTLSDLQAQLPAIQTDLTALDQQLQVLDGQITALQGQITALNGQISTIQQAIDDGILNPALADPIAIQNMIAGLSAPLGNVNTALGGISSTVGTAQGIASGLATDIGDATGALNFAASILPVLTNAVLGAGGSWGAAANAGVPGVQHDVLSLDHQSHYDNLEQQFQVNWVGAHRSMAMQLTIVAMQQAAMIGGLLDAKHQLETQLLLDKKEAEAHKDYHPDQQMCRIGTSVRSLTAAEALTDVTANVINMALLRRDTLADNRLSAAGSDLDKRSRLAQFKKVYCDRRDEGGNLGGDPGLSAADRAGVICEANVPAARINKDINYTDTLENRYTMEIDFTDGAPPTADEQDILALAYNLFSHQTFGVIPTSSMIQEYAKDDYQDTRSVNAIRSVARNSFAHLVGMRTASAPIPQNERFLNTIVRELGVPEDEIIGLIGENPSYFAQMEILTKKMFLDEDFYTNLYTKPVNLDRIGASLQAISLMQDRDRFESSLRREMLISLLLELKIRDLQDSASNNIVNGVGSIFQAP